MTRSLLPRVPHVRAQWEWLRARIAPEGTEADLSPLFVELTASCAGVARETRHPRPPVRAP